MIKLVAVDLDGTLLDPDKKITPEVRLAVAAAKAVGVKIVICTGRPLPGVLPILEELNLREAGDFVITYNGGLVQRADTGEAFIEKKLTRDDVLDIDNFARKHRLPMMGITRDGIYTAQRDIGKYIVFESNMVQMPLHVRLPEEIAELDVIKCMIVDDPERLDIGIAELPFEWFERFNLVKSTPFYLEFNNHTVSKGEAVRSLTEKLFLESAEVMAIGDEENDRSMLEVAESSVVMANGKADLKKIAKYVTKSNAESGVAHAINSWVLPDYS
jgi:Cof subfamily protein (haloacid dehalogenase superfamily)